MQEEIEHVVVLMLENRSFDNVLAWLYDQNNPPMNFIPKNTPQQYMGLEEHDLEQYTNTLTTCTGEVVFSSPPIKGVPSVASGNYLNSPQYDPFEPYDHVTKQIFGFHGGTEPTMKGFLQDYASLWWEQFWVHNKEEICAVMETYTDRELPVLYGLARQYAVSDLWFSSVPTQTNPNRAFVACGTSDGQLINGSLGKSTFLADTIWNRLTELSPETSWSIFWQSDLVPCLVPGPFSVPNTFPSLNRIPRLSDHYSKMDAFHELARNGQLPHYSFIEPQWTITIHIDTEVKWYQGQTLENTVRALMLGWQGNDLHPPGDIRSGENLLANVYTSLIANEEAWNRTLLIITFDEHGGLYDHVPPPMAIPPDDHNEHGFNFDQFGVRVPTLFISPRINKGTVIRSDDPQVPFDHTSIISTVLKWRNVDKSLWKMGRRVDAAPTFENVVTLKEPRKDAIIVTGSNLPVSTDDVVKMGDPFYLRNKDGECFIAIPPDLIPYTRIGPEKEKMPLQFIGGSGNVTHGSFVIVQAQDPILKQANILDVSTLSSYCTYEENQHTLEQWWTIKSLENPNVGAPIRYGDRIYLENHIYKNFVSMIPGRLTAQKCLFGTFIKLVPICEENSEDNYWIIEK